MFFFFFARIESYVTSKNVFFVFFITYYVRPCLAKPCFSSLENCQNRIKGVFAKQSFGQKIP